MNKVKQYEKETADAMKKLFSSCKSLVNISEVKHVGLLASIASVEEEARVRIRARLKQGQWPSEADALRGKFDDDVVQWFMLLCPTTSDSLIEVVMRAELFEDDEVMLLAHLNEKESSGLATHVRVWTPLMP